MDKKYFGKYRGKVIDNHDPEQYGRLKIVVPSLLLDNEVWAMPSVPYAGPGVGLVLTLPIGANVWVEFEEGNLDFPICTGSYWRKGEFPAEANSDPAAIKLLKTDGITLTFNDQKDAGGVTIKVASPAVSQPVSITMDKEGISLSFNEEQAAVNIDHQGIALLNQGQSIKITQAKVSINGDHLEVS